MQQVPGDVVPVPISVGELTEDHEANKSLSR